MNAILDTGPWVALIDRSESKHDICVQWLKSYSGKLYSTEAVLTEVLYLLNFSVKAQTAAIDFVLKSVVEIIPSSVESLKKVKNLIKKYSNPFLTYLKITGMNLGFLLNWKVTLMKDGIKRMVNNLEGY